MDKNLKSFLRLVRLLLATVIFVFAVFALAADAESTSAFIWSKVIGFAAIGVAFLVFIKS